MLLGRRLFTERFPRLNLPVVDDAAVQRVLWWRPPGPGELISTVGIEGGRLHGRDGRYDELQALFLMRLVRLTKLRDQLRTQRSPSGRRRQLVEAAFRSTLRDCEALGVEAEAHALLESD